MNATEKLEEVIELVEELERKLELLKETIDREYE